MGLRSPQGVLSGPRIPAPPALTPAPGRGAAWPPAALPLIWEPQQLVGGASPPISCLPSLTAAHPGASQPHGVCFVSLSVLGEGGNKTELLGELQRCISGMRKLPSFPLVLSLVWFVNLNKESEETG